MEKLLSQFFNGECYNAYEYFGAHKHENGYVFRVFAPHALEVELVGDFNFWNGSSYKMEKVDSRGIFELFVNQIKEDYQLYRFHIKTQKGTWILKSDPYAFYSELRPKTASKTYDLTYNYHDEKWMKKRSKCYDLPLNIYELHLGSFQKHLDDSFLSYEEMIAPLIRYLKENHFTHIEIMPLMENPLDMSWGYLCSGYFSMTSRYGNPGQFKYFIDKLHQAGFGIIMDFVPVHFIKDDYALGFFDGGNVYESDYKENQESQWGSYLFDYSKPAVMSFMLSALYFYLSEFHMDGIRFDAISNMLYKDGNSENGLNAPNINWLKKANDFIAKAFPNVMLIAEDSSSFQGITKPTFENGLGFDYKWDLGWMNDTLKYIKEDPYFRGEHLNYINFSMYYFYSERFLLPFSHDEVVHMKGSIINKINGSYEEKFKEVKTLYTYMFTHPGKKLNFMANELASFDEWNENKPVNFDILKYPQHDAFHNYFKQLCYLYTTEKCLYADEYSTNNFKWISCDNKNNVFIYERNYKQSSLVIILNFSNVQYDHYRFHVTTKKTGHFIELLNSDTYAYNGNNFINDYTIRIDHQDEIGIKIPSFGAVILKYVKK